MEENIKQKVLKANEIAHDACALTHTRAVPYQSRKNTRNYIWSLVIKQLKENNVKSENAEILEVACGTGTFVGLFRKLKAKSYKGIDISGEMIKIAKANNIYNNVSFEKISLEDFAKDHQQKYDIIVASSFLHHLVDMEEGLLQLKSLLKDDGIFVGLHELDNTRKQTSIEHFDNELSYLMGYGGYIAVKFSTRLKSFIKYILGVFKSIFFTRKKSKVKMINNNINNNANNVDYVDYQLNFGFNLKKNEIANKMGIVIPYCYYNFAEFRYLKKILNHYMFVMKKEV